MSTECVMGILAYHLIIVVVFLFDRGRVRASCGPVSNETVAIALCVRGVAGEGQ